MIVSTTYEFETANITKYLGIVSAEVIVGANALKDFAASITDFFGGRSSTYERTLKAAKEEAMSELIQEAMILGANAIVGAQFSFNTVGSGGMLMITITGTAVVIA